MATETLDAPGMQCPMPILKTKKAIKALNAGDTLEVIATDPGSVKDMSAFCTSTGHTLVEQSDADGVYTFVIEKAA